MGYMSDLSDEQWAVIEPIVTYKTKEELVSVQFPSKRAKCDRRWSLTTSRC